MSFNPSAQQSFSKIENMKAWFNIASMCLKRNNPLLNMFRQIQYVIYVMLTVNQKLKIVKQRVNHMKYRLHQMEQLIDANSTSQKFTKGSSLNQLR
ncbi:MAG: hypothetical protein AB1782_07015 [Cyanobacteriota bacterium]